ncbi:MAG: tetratricopeptide repeat protein [Pseudomonadales bacterium]|nr:tetratricopeptide repeat protein [Pseudomonadales bacterium]
MLSPTGITTDPSTIVDVNESNVQQILIEQSQQQLVVCHFWSPQSPEAMAQTQALQALNGEYQGHFILALVNIDDMMAIAQQLGVQSLPTVLIFQAGQAVDGLAGPQTPEALKELLEKYLPKPWDLQFQQASELMATDDFIAAIALLEPAFIDSKNRPDISLALSHCYIERARLDEAESLLSAILMADQDAYFQQLQSQLQLKRESAHSPEMKALEKKLAESPEDMDIKMQLAVQYYEQQLYRKACELLIGVLQVDKNYDGCRKTLLDIFKSLGNKDPLVIEFQRQLFSILY